MLGSCSLVKKRADATLFLFPPTITCSFTKRTDHPCFASQQRATGRIKEEFLFCLFMYASSDVNRRSFHVPRFVRCVNLF